MGMKKYWILRYSTSAKTRGDYTHMESLQSALDLASEIVSREEADEVFVFALMGRTSKEALIWE